MKYMQMGTCHASRRRRNVYVNDVTGTYLIQIPCLHGVRGTQDLVEVMCPEIVSNKAEDGHPNICLGNSNTGPLTQQP